MRPKRVLIFLVGSLGDTIVALPALHLIKRVFPHAERKILTSYSRDEKAAPMSALLDGSGLVDGYFRFPLAFESPRELLGPLRQIRHWKPDLVVHLHEPRGSFNAYRDAAFFFACGVSRIIGLPLGPDLQAHREDPITLETEHRTDYLGRRVQKLGDIQALDPQSWDLSISADEQARGQAALEGLRHCTGIVTVSIGAKLETKDWGDQNWNALLTSLSQRLPNWGLAILGAPVEHARSDELLRSWRGSAVNLCGVISLRECGAVLQASNLFVGHDSGPMHLAAAVGTPTVAIFSARERPGKWFPYGKHHKVFYNKTECFGCLLNECVAFKKMCILSIDAAMVADAATTMALDSLRSAAR